jgi:hypothetical protein
MELLKERSKVDKGIKDIKQTIPHWISVQISTSIKSVFIITSVYNF